MAVRIEAQRRSAARDAMALFAQKLTGLVPQTQDVNLMIVFVNSMIVYVNLTTV